jgi:hypothetical protein
MIRNLMRTGIRPSLHDPGPGPGELDAFKDRNRHSDEGGPDSFLADR